MNAIEAEGLTKRFRRVKGYRDLALYRWQRESDVAVQDVSLQVRKGEVFGVLGENGAGKTTLIRMLSTTLLPTSGRAHVGGHDVVANPQGVRRLIGLVSGDERSFYWRLTGRQNLRYFSALYHLPRRTAERRIDQLLRTLDAASYADRRFDSYSTGIRQKFAIARGMLTEPEILFLDEPTRALDPIAADEVRRHIADHIVGELNCTVLLATHTLWEAEEICDRVAIMHKGAVVESGSLPELQRRQGLGTVLELVVSGAWEAVRDAVCAVPGVGGLDLVQKGPLTHLDVRLLADGEDLAPVLRAVLGSVEGVQSATTRRPTLEDIYRATHAER